MRTNHTYGLLGAPSAGTSPLSMENSHITYMEVPSTSYVVSIIASSPKPLDVISNGEESVSTIDIDQDDDHGRMCGRRCEMRHGQMCGRRCGMRQGRWEHGGCRLVL